MSAPSKLLGHRVSFLLVVVRDTPLVAGILESLTWLMLGFQSLESRAVIGKVLIVWRLGLLHPYLPDGSRLARGVISGGTARLAAFVFLFLL